MLLFIIGMRCMLNVTKHLRNIFLNHLKSKDLKRVMTILWKRIIFAFCHSGNLSYVKHEACDV